MWMISKYIYIYIYTHCDWHVNREPLAWGVHNSHEPQPHYPRLLPGSRPTPRCPKRKVPRAAAIGTLETVNSTITNTKHYTKIVGITAHSQVISRRLYLLSLRWSHKNILFGIRVFLPFYKSSTCIKRRWTAEKRSDVATTPFEQ